MASECSNGLTLESWIELLPAVSFKQKMYQMASECLNGLAFESWIELLPAESFKQNM